MDDFALDDRLRADTIRVGDFGLSLVLLMNDSRFPWAVLVPRRRGVVELHDLMAADRTILVEEAAQLSGALARLTGATKTNVAALGNQVRQFHVHVIARSHSDSAWPGPVWGVGAPSPYADAAGEAFAARLAGELRLK